MEYLAEKIYTKMGLVKDNIFLEKKVLHLGCGHNKIPGTIGVDAIAHPEVDVVHDLNRFAWPFSDNSIDVVVAHSVLEHLDDLVSFFKEINRICKNEARLIVAVPYFRCIDSFTDPTHQHFFTSRSLDFFIEEGRDLARYDYLKQKLSLVGFWYGWPSESSNWLVRQFKNFIKKHSKFYDQYLSLLFPVKTLTCELKIKK